MILHKLLPAVVIADFLRFDADGMMAEHWDVVQPHPEPDYDPHASLGREPRTVPGGVRHHRLSCHAPGYVPSATRSAVVRTTVLLRANCVSVRLTSGDGHDALQDEVKVVVGTSDDPHQQIAGTRHGVDLEDLGNRAQVGDDTSVRALRDGQGGEREHTQPGRGGIDVGAIADDHPAVLEAAQPGQHRAASAFQHPGQLGHGRMRRHTQSPDQPAIERIERRRRRRSSPT